MNAADHSPAIKHQRPGPTQPTPTGHPLGRSDVIFEGPTFSRNCVPMPVGERRVSLSASRSAGGCFRDGGARRLLEETSMCRRAQERFHARHSLEHANGILGSVFVYSSG